MISTNSVDTSCDKGKKAAAMCLVIGAISFLGFCVESVFVAITDGYIDNRNMLLPFLFGYGLGIAGIYGVFGTPTEPRFFRHLVKGSHVFGELLYYFAVVFLCVSVGEALMGLFVEHFFHITWWDYSGIPLHITKFTSVPTSTAFAVLIMLFMHFLLDPLYRRFQKIHPKTLYVTAVLWMLLLSLNFIGSGVRMYLTNDFVRIWRIEW